MEKFRGWIRKRPIAWAIGVFVLAAIIGGAIGSASQSSLEDEKADLEDQVAQVESDAESSEEAQEEAELEAEEVEDERAEIIATAEGKAEKIVGKAKGEAEELADVKAEISAAEGELEQVEASLSGAQEEKRLSVIPGNGTFQAEVDYLPGTYKAPGGPGCYWATLNSPDPFDIASNENASGPTIAPVTTPYFQTDGCGQWTRIGE
jgi:F0F1-type ATP synthase membrane subunit b/b'